jgi:hypothetical protein
MIRIGAVWAWAAGWEKKQAAARMAAEKVEQLIFTERNGFEAFASYNGGMILGIPSIGKVASAARVELPAPIWRSGAIHRCGGL